ncbi:MAG: Putative membrane protein [uncultured Campylobacterales bacterium]|uniref:Membrane protein n=1 Tax=uncultured Campylobacterales bacterium TaxID=352960 RepID=A0A6S6SAG8_9BACT|nr:MAG: Putative membrane protein [uncultured Campylobacterales bacterium]
MKIDFNNYLVYKFLNSLFAGVSIGAIFTIYAPIKDPYIYSIGGIALGFGLLAVAFFYEKILNIKAYLFISLLVEVLIFLTIVVILVFKYSYINALFVYIGYQVSFIFGSYLTRAETIILNNAKKLSLIDIYKQMGYLIGMFCSFVFYKLAQTLYNINSSENQVYYIHFVFLTLQILIIIFLLRAFKGRHIDNNS